MGLNPFTKDVKDYDGNVTGKTTNWVTTGVAGGLTALFLTVAATGIYKVPEGTATIETWGGAISDVSQPGFHYAVPLIQSTHPYNTTKVFEVPLEGLNIYYSPDEIERDETDVEGEGPATEDVASDNAQQYTIHTANIRVSIDPEITEVLHRKYQSMDAIQRLVRDRGTEAYKAVVRKIDPLKINAQRELIGPNAKAILQAAIDEEVGQEGAIKIESVVFLDFNFESGVEQAFEAANKERAGVQAEQYKLEKEGIRVQTAAKEGEADAAREKAAALGRAEAIRSEGAALRENPEVLNLRAIEAWKSGGAQVPGTLVVPDGNGATEFLLPLGQRVDAPKP